MEFRRRNSKVFRPWDSRANTSKEEGGVAHREGSVWKEQAGGAHKSH